MYWMALGSRHGARARSLSDGAFYRLWVVLLSHLLKLKELKPRPVFDDRNQNIENLKTKNMSKSKLHM